MLKKIPKTNYKKQIIAIAFPLIIIVISVIFVFLSVSTTNKQKSTDIRSKAAPTQVIARWDFNGSNAEGWHGEDGATFFSVQNGYLKIQQKPADRKKMNNVKIPTYIYYDLNKQVQPGMFQVKIKGFYNQVDGAEKQCFEGNNLKTYDFNFELIDNTTPKNTTTNSSFTTKLVTGFTNSALIKLPRKKSKEKEVIASSKINAEPANVNKIGFSARPNDQCGWSVDIDYIELDFIPSD